MEGTAEASVLPPPVYTNEEEPKEEGEGGTNGNEEGGAANPLPYPVINSDPAYPPLLDSYSTDI